MAEYIDESLPEDLKKIIHTLRIFLFDNDGQVLQQAINGSDSLEESSARTLFLLIKMLEQQLGDDLDDEELYQVITHLAGSIAEFAQGMEDPDAQDLATAVDDIRGRTMELFMDEDGEAGEAAPPMEEGMEGEMPMPPQGQPPEQQALMGPMQ